MSNLSKFDNPHALASNLTEATIGATVSHPRLGTGTVTAVTETEARVQWDRMGSWVQYGDRVSLAEAECVILTDPDKYFNESDFAEELNEMNDIDMTGADYEALMESYVDVPSPRDTVLTKQSKFKSDAESQPLSGLDGDGGSTNEPREEDKDPKDAPDTPSVASMDAPSRTAKVGKRKMSRKGDQSGSDESGSSDSGSEKKGNPFAKKSDDSDSGSDDEPKKKKDDSEMKEGTGNGLSMADFDIEGAMSNVNVHDRMYGDMDGLYEMGDDYMDEGRPMEMDHHTGMSEHDMGAGEIAVTQEFLVKLLSAASKVGEEHYETIAKCIAECSGEDRTLDVSDIGMVMDKMKSEQNGGEEPAGNDMDDYDGGDDEGGDTPLMGAMEGKRKDLDPHARKMKHKNDDRKKFAKRFDDDDDDDDGLDEGKLPDALKKHQIKKGSDADSDGKTNECDDDMKKNVTEAWIAGIPMMGAQKTMMNTDGLDEDEADIMDIKRLAGMIK